MNTIVKWLLVAALCAGVVYGIFGIYEWWRSGVFNQGYAKAIAEKLAESNADKARRANEVTAAVEKARKEEQDKAALAAKGERDAREKAERQAATDRAAATRSAASAGGLSRHVAALDRAALDLGMPSAAACPGEFAKQRDAAIRARAVLGSCVEGHRRLAADADSAVGAVTLKLDTALGFINAVRNQ
jgi:hypothetical protein